MGNFFWGLRKGVFTLNEISTTMQIEAFDNSI
jgi:hypothetical protein